MKGIDVLCVPVCTCLSNDGMDNSYFYLNHNAQCLRVYLLENWAPRISVLNMYHSLHTVASITKGIINLIENEKGKLRVIFNHNAKRIAIDKHDQLRTRLIIHA